MEKEKSPIAFAGVFVMIGLIVLGICLVVSVSKFKSYDRVVFVKGLCEKEVSANMATWPLAYKLIGNDLISLYKEMNLKNDVLLKFLKTNGISESDIFIAAPQVFDLQADRYYDPNKIYRYNITSVITVATSDVAKVREIITKQTDLLAQGIALYSDDYAYKVNYEFTGLNDIKPQMIEEATANARAAAQKFAADSKSKLGKIKTASQGQFSVSNRDENTPYIKNVRVVTSVEYYLK